MYKIPLILLSLGVVVILLSFIKITTTKKKNKYTANRSFMEILNNSKIIEFFTQIFYNADSSSSKIVKLLKKLELIHESETAEKFYNESLLGKSSSFEFTKFDKQKALKKVFINKVIIMVLTLIISLSLYKVFTINIVNQDLNNKSIYEQSEYRISEKNAAFLTEYIGDSYKDYFEKNDIKGFYKYINSYSKKADLDLGDEAIKSLIRIYYKAYQDDKFSLNGILVCIALTIGSKFLINMNIELKYKKYRYKIVDEYYKLEMIAISNMGVEDFNVYDIINQMCKYSIYLRTALIVCLNKYPNDNIVALDELIDKIDNDDFGKFIGILKSCLNSRKDINVDILKLQRKLRLSIESTKKERELEYKAAKLTLAELSLELIWYLDLFIPILSMVDLSNFAL